ncbi:hypothetical protein GTCCBUS3UF5_22550 [Geobacillus thermoleovorans CCB_US3_UF5]|uniref:Uncharacterized protein n=2 Tax=Anoxybacillaceae TaxID=3120669 RepID=A0ABM5MIK0_GEOTH|nr:hypothetical protein GTCCBUS3UF5_22550 [Geobacillus thermoleovorans CCB_US3_UF5]
MGFLKLESSIKGYLSLHSRTVDLGKMADFHQPSRETRTNDKKWG